MYVCIFTSKTLCMSRDSYDVSRKLQSESTNNKFKRLLPKEKRIFKWICLDINNNTILALLI